MITLDEELAVQYRAECREHLASLEAELLAIEKAGPAIDGDRIDRAFRAVHSIKGGAVFLELTLISAIARQVEEVLTLLRSRKITATPELITLLLTATDRLEELIAGLGSPAAANAIVTALRQLCAGIRPIPVRGDRRPRILLVEDDFTSRLLLQSFLARYGECHAAVNGREAVNAFRAALEQSRPYDLICMDIMMPEMDGHQAVRECRTLEKSRGVLPTYGARIIMTTTVDDVREVILCFKELCDEYLMKPIDLAKLLAFMKSYGLVA
jgi:two-component system chemotaxis response regulator CheY